MSRPSRALRRRKVIIIKPFNSLREHKWFYNNNLSYSLMVITIYYLLEYIYHSYYRSKGLSNTFPPIHSSKKLFSILLPDLGQREDIATLKPDSLLFFCDLFIPPFHLPPAFLNFFHFHFFVLPFFYFCF